MLVLVVIAIVCVVLGCLALLSRVGVVILRRCDCDQCAVTCSVDSLWPVQGPRRMYVVSLVIRTSWLSPAARQVVLVLVYCQSLCRIVVAMVALVCDRLVLVVVVAVSGVPSVIVVLPARIEWSVLASTVSVHLRPPLCCWWRLCVGVVGPLCVQAVARSRRLVGACP